eukprot:GHVU01033828.1.p1 GENE.GHVU01033828.1~~GHVU01033828.1.p1  ORF type:complete len:133 (+),score=7.53 GHVU01033828.1:363-761(+)
MSGQFKGAQLRWSTLEREAYAVRTVLLRFEFLFYRRKGIIILTDHRNLEFLLGKESKKDFPPYVKDKLYFPPYVKDATFHLVRQKFYWLGMYKDIRHFVRSCLHCLRGSSTKVIPRPLGETLSATPKRSLAH